MPYWFVSGFRAPSQVPATDKDAVAKLDVSLSDLPPRTFAAHAMSEHACNFTDHAKASWVAQLNPAHHNEGS